MPNLASSRQDRGPRIPVTPGSTAPSGRRTSSKISSEVTDARRESFRSMFFAENPLESVGTMKPLMPSSVRAHTMATSAIPPLVIHIFVPLSTQSESSPRALVRMCAGSDPKSGSVRPKHPMTSPAAIFGNHSCFCSSEPNFQMGNMASDPWTETKLRNPASPASSSKHARP